MKDRKQQSASFSFGTFEMTLITLVLIGLKFTASPELPWPVVLAPLWIPATFVLVVLAVPAIVLVLGITACAIFGGALIVWEFVTGIWKGGAK